MESGERLCYRFAPEAPQKEVVAKVGSAVLSARIRGEELEVADELGCTVGPVPTGQGARGARVALVGLGLVSLAWVALSRRKRATRG
jgi:hypothetical protein